MKFLVFDIFGPFAHFRAIYTTSSPQSYPIPSRPTILGMLGAIIGLEKSHITGQVEPYLTFFSEQDPKIAIHIINNIKHTSFNINHIFSKDNEFFKSGKRTQIIFDLLKDVKYRIYVNINNKDLYNKLKQNLSAKQTHFTLSLGLSEFLANFEFIGEFEAKYIQENGEYIKTNNVIPFTKQLKITQKDVLQKHTLVFHLNEKREYTSIKDYIIKTNWEHDSYIESIQNNYYKLENNENIVLL